MTDSRTTRRWRTGTASPACMPALPGLLFGQVTGGRPGFCLQGLGQADQALDGPGLALLLHETAEVHTDQALRTEGEPYARRALEMAERLGDVELQAQSLTTWGIFASSSGESLAMTFRAVDLAEKHGLLLASERAHRYLSFRLRDQGD